MAINPTSALASVATIQQVGTGSESELQATRLLALRFAQLEPPGFELCRAGRSFVGGMALKAGGVVPVIDLPTTTGPFVLFNAYPSGGKVLCVKRISTFFCSGSIPATGYTLFAGVTPSVLATPLVANGATNFRTQSKRGFGTPGAFIDVAKTIPAGTAWSLLGGQTAVTATTTTGPGFSVDCSSDPFVVPPLFALTVGNLGDTTGTPLYGFTVEWDEIDCDLP